MSGRVNERNNTRAGFNEPFHVVTVEGGVFTDGLETMEEAEYSATWRNAKAEALGITTRYQAVAKPE